MEEWRTNGPLKKSVPKNFIFMAIATFTSEGR